MFLPEAVYNFCMSIHRENLKEPGHQTRSYHREHGLPQTIVIFICMLLVLLVLHISIQTFRINGESMEPSLQNQEFVLINKAAYLFQPPARGDIIVFQYPLNPQQIYVKRIIAIPGDIISVINETVIVNGVTLHESYINKDDELNPYPPINQYIVGPDEYFVMGDNRGDSSDSRDWGFVPRQNIIGKAELVYWPTSAHNLGLLPNVGTVFARVPS
jgi:signal peptidase I